MKKLLPFLLILLFLSSGVNAQKKADNKTLTVTYSWTKIKSFGSNQLAVWIEDEAGNHVATLFATKYTAQGGYKKREVSLSEWTNKFDIKNSSKEEIDAISGATPSTGIQTLVWNGKDKKGKAVVAGTYVVRMEANIKNEDKEFCKAKIKIGSGNQKSNGEITYSRPELATGDLLFKDVVVEYK
jgi:hypothetical protein